MNLTFSISILACCLAISNSLTCWVSYNKGKIAGCKLGARYATKATINWYNTNIFAPAFEQMGKDNMKNFKSTNYNK
jgi:hypothetical protein